MAWKPWRGAPIELRPDVLSFASLINHRNPVPRLREADRSQPSEQRIHFHRDGVVGSSPESAGASTGGHRALKTTRGSPKQIKFFEDPATFQVD